jgi:DNA polymerase-3 subunit delta'
MNPANESNSNWGILGHEWAVNLLKNHLEKDRPRHAYLFTGPDGVGRRTLALRFAQVLNSPNWVYDPGHTASKQIARMQHPDLSVLRRLEGDRDIKIDAVRELQHTLSLTPYMAAYRVALLLNFEEANQHAANALLKTLEEPPGQVVLLLTAESTDSLLPTISSRCEVVRLRPVPIDRLAAGLESVLEFGAEEARLLAHISGGKPGYALHLAENPDLLEERTKLIEDQIALLGGSRVSRFAYAEQLGKDKLVFRQALLIWLAFWRDILLLTSKSRAPLTNPDRREDIARLSRKIDSKTAREVVGALENRLGELRTNANTRLAAEALMLQLPFLSL